MYYKCVGQCASRCVYERSEHVHTCRVYDPMSTSVKHIECRKVPDTLWLCFQALPYDENRFTQRSPSPYTHHLKVTGLRVYSGISLTKEC